MVRSQITFWKYCTIRKYFLRTRLACNGRQILFSGHCWRVRLTKTKIDDQVLKIECSHSRWEWNRICNSYHRRVIQRISGVFWLAVSTSWWTHHKDNAPVSTKKFSTPRMSVTSKTPLRQGKPVMQHVSLPSYTMVIPSPWIKGCGLHLHQGHQKVCC